MENITEKILIKNDDGTIFTAVCFDCKHKTTIYTRFCSYCGKEFKSKTEEIPQVDIRQYTTPI